PQSPIRGSRMFGECGIVLEKLVDDLSVPIDVAHYILMALSVREEAGPEFALRHPAASWLCTLLVSFSGTFLTNFLLGETLLKPLMSRFDMIMFATIWYIISIPNSFAVICTYGPVKNVISVMKEIQRNHKIMLGVGEGAARFVDHSLLHVLIGCTKGNGSGIVKIVQQFVYGKWAPAENEVLKPSATTKATILTALLYASPHVPREIAYLCGASVLVGTKILSLAQIHKSPVDKTYNAICFALIDLPRMLESQMFGSDQVVEHSMDEAKAETKNENPAYSELSSTEEKSSQRESCIDEEWKEMITESLVEITGTGRTNLENIQQLNELVGKLDFSRDEIYSIRTDILLELRELKRLFNKPSSLEANPIPDSTVILTHVNTDSSID
ncbi:hypothetical protein PFISCL1PPCAC_8361, partial [Pristionchus fissidentatus]